MGVSLYNGEIEIEFNEGNHRYKVNGEFKPGVTTVLNVINKPLLLEWSAHMASEAFKDAVARAMAEGQSMDDKWLKKTAEACKKAHQTYSGVAKDLGKEVHAKIEQYLAKTEAPLTSTDPMVNRLLDGFIGWFMASGFKVEGTEQIVYSKKYDYCGTYDVLFSKDGKLYLGDAKTTKRSYTAQQGLYTEYVAQLGGYAQAHWEETGNKPDELFVINPDKTYGELQFITLSELGISVDDAINTFLEVYQLWSSLRPLDHKVKRQNTLKKGQWYMKERLDG